MTDDGRCGTVLVVDDSATKRYLLVNWLSRAGYEVVEAVTGTEALARVDAGGIDLVVLDVRLPDLDGFEVCERIKSDPRHAALPVIHVSAHAVDVVDRTQGLTRGADAYLAEPIEPEELVATAQAVLRYYRARQRAELLAKRLATLAETTLAVNSASSFARLLKVAAEGAAAIFEVPVAVVAETVDGESLAGVCVGPGSPAEVRPWAVDDGDVPVGSTMRTDQPADWGLVDWPEGETVTVAAARLRVDRPPLYVAVPASAPTAGPSVLVQLAQAVAAAVEAQRSYDEEHRIAVTLQRSLLPRRLPDLTGFQLAVRYEPASAQTEVGGDFYELAMIDGQLLVAIGDVAGHSLHAATIMAELRHAVRAYAVEGHQPGVVIERTDELLRTLLPNEFATICLLLLDPATGRCRMASAGHLPPLLVTDGASEFLEHRAPLLGVRVTRPADLEFVMPRGSTLVLYTDGLIERRDADIDEGLRALAISAATVEDDLDRFCERLLVELAAPEIHDDIAVVALHRR
ncbi:Response regulator receiver domain-containing protein [Micromonospora pattaloongensis]|uniref:Response regulator receiver domain-containing protein n=1 Tax=Micromonospora pattaloongensis TaxID=405436 RepID=A0A1H3SG13_9ACTN|nr:fused response regulator/phosphatase [Micromonospora pattaloongensis]SDZ36946.1 Response regulator receiver domain-containing protein [Micromonospora pattaloongensis]